MIFNFFIRDASGVVKTERKSIAEIFAQIWEELYRSRQLQDERNLHNDTEVHQRINSFSAEELLEALKAMKTGRAPHKKGLVAEMLKTGGHRLRSVLLELISTVSKPHAPTPSEWQKSVFKVLFQEDDMRQAKNYRPICILSVLYKLFSTMLCRRLQPMLDSELRKI